MFCKNCGEQIDDRAAICPKCGVPVNNNAFSQNDAPSVGFGILGFFFPLIGLILYLVWKNQTPLKAKSAGQGALIGFIIGIVIVVFYSILSAVLIGSAVRYY